MKTREEIIEKAKRDLIGGGYFTAFYQDLSLPFLIQDEAETLFNGDEHYNPEIVNDPERTTVEMYVQIIKELITERLK